MWRCGSGEGSPFFIPFIATSWLDLQFWTQREDIYAIRKNSLWILEELCNFNWFSYHSVTITAGSVFANFNLITREGPFRIVTMIFYVRRIIWTTEVTSKYTYTNNMNVLYIIMMMAKHSKAHVKRFVLILSELWMSKYSIAAHSPSNSRMLILSGYLLWFIHNTMQLLNRCLFYQDYEDRYCLIFLSKFDFKPSNFIM